MSSGGSSSPPSHPATQPELTSQLTPEDGTAILAIAAHELKNALGGIGVALARCEMRLKTGQAVALSPKWPRTISPSRSVHGSAP